MSDKTRDTTDDPLRYDLWVEDAFRAVARRALKHTEAHGLPGGHHFYVTFRTGAPGVRVPAYLKALHPEDMTIVLQHQFRDLKVEDEGFSVALSFNGKLETLYVPFAAVSAFADPSVNFGLQFKAPAPPAPEAKDTPAPEPAPAPEGGPPHGGQVIALDSFRKK